MGGTLVAQPAASPGGARLGEGGEASQDYMAAVQAMEDDPAAALLEVAEALGQRQGQVRAHWGWWTSWLPCWC